MEVELLCFREKVGAEKERHFWNVCGMLWGDKNERKKFWWHPWAGQMVAAGCAEKYVGLSSCASGGKTDFLAVWGIVNWLAAPANTLVLITSTSLKESRQRVWGSVLEYFLASASPLPGKILDSFGMIRTVFPNERFSDKCGIHLITGEKSKERENIGKIGGLNSRISQTGRR